jgi:Fe-Mn family superoxide dismutase
MLYQARQFDHLIGMEGFSDSLVRTHLSLYEGYVRNTNMLADRLTELGRQNQTGTPEYAELNRHFGWEFNGMRLHEYYFANLIKGGSKLDRKSALFNKIESDFGSLENWRKDFVATAALRGIGWTILYYEPIGGRLFNVWVTEHDMGHLCGAVPILVLDVFEHAYLADYGLKRKDYIESFMKVADWNVAIDRFVAASGRKSAERVIGRSAHTKANVDEKRQPVEALAS